MPTRSPPRRPSEAKLAYLRWRWRGMDERTAAVMTALELGLPPRADWTLAEIERWRFTRWLYLRGRIRP